MSDYEPWEEKAFEIAEATTLSKREAEVYVLHALEDHTLEKTAYEMGISPGNVASKWHNLKKKIYGSEERLEVLENTSELEKEID